MSFIPRFHVSQLMSQPEMFAEKLRKACHETGFFVLYHDLGALAQSQLVETRRFFEFPMQKKMQISYEQHSSFRGYMRMGVENTQGKTDCREQIEYATDYEVGNMKMFPPYERLKGRNPWPSSFQPTLQPITTEYARKLERIAFLLVQMMYMALNLDKSDATEFFGRKPHWSLKLVSYPGVNNSFGVGPHTDSNFLTMILQDGCPGLQIFSKDSWFDLPSIGPDALICNLGELAEILSDGYFLATPHRVLGGKRRISVPFFYNPSLETTVHPCVDSSTLLWGRPKETQVWRAPENKMLSSVGENTFKSLAQSHPQVFAKHHMDLKALSSGEIQIIRDETFYKRQCK